MKLSKYHWGGRGMPVSVDFTLLTVANTRRFNTLLMMYLVLCVNIGQVTNVFYYSSEKETFPFPRSESKCY